MKYNVDEIQKNMHIRQVEGIGDRLEEDIRNILNRAGIYFRIFSRAKTPFSIAQKLEKPGVWIWGTRQEDAGSQLDCVSLCIIRMIWILCGRFWRKHFGRWASGLKNGQYRRRI